MSYKNKTTFFTYFLNGTLVSKKALYYPRGKPLVQKSAFLLTLAPFKKCMKKVAVIFFKRNNLSSFDKLSPIQISVKKFFLSRPFTFFHAVYFFSRSFLYHLSVCVRRTRPNITYLYINM